MAKINIKLTTLDKLHEITDEIDARHYKGFIKEPGDVVAYLIGWYKESLKQGDKICARNLVTEKQENIQE